MTETTTAGKRNEFLSGQAAEGEILAVKLRREMLPPAEAFRYALDIGTALSRAHAQGLVHGKVSPQNILIGSGGAALLQPVSGGDVSLVYRAPEQVLGKPADERSDIFCYGILLYELASGEPPFQGEGPELNASILEDAPPPLTPHHPLHQTMENVMVGCLEKNPGKRRQRIQNAVTEMKLMARTLGKPGSGMDRRALLAPAATAPNRSRGGKRLVIPDEGAAAASTPLRRAVRPSQARARYRPPKRWIGLRLWVIAAVVLLACAAGVAAVMLLPSRNAAPVYRFSVDQEEGKYPGMPAVSPDGRSLSWSATGPEGKRMLWVQALDGARAKPIPNTEGAAAPFWSPDSNGIGFFTGDYLKKIEIKDGAPIGAPANICKVDRFSGGGSWGKDGTILFASGLTSGLSRAPASGGAPRVVTSLNAARNERSHLWPQFLPDGRHFIFFVAAAESTDTGVYSGSLDSPNYSMLFSSETNAVFSRTGGSDGYLLFIRNSSLMGQPFSASKLKTSGDALTLATNIEPVESLSLAQVSASDNGTMVYQSAGKSTRQLSWVDRTGKTVGDLGEPGDWGLPRISPDGKRIAVGKKDEKSGVPVLWILNSDDATAIQLTHMTGGGAAQPVWSPDGSRIVFSNEDQGVFDLYVQPASGEGKAESLYRSPHRKLADDWSRDGHTLLFDELTPGLSGGQYMLNMSDRKASTIVDTIHGEGYGALSPDGKWLAYQSDETGENEIVVQAFEAGASLNTKRIYSISKGGGALPHWRRDGRELYFITQPGKIMAVNVHPSGGEFAFDPPVELFQTRPTPKRLNLYDAAPDGDRFVVNSPMDWPTGSKIVVITSWLKELQ